LNSRGMRLGNGEGFTMRNFINIKIVRVFKSRR
jgi:hypothetical protein